MRPRIGVTGPDRGGLVAWACARFAIEREGGRAVRITPSRPRAIDGLDGLVLGGGADVDPTLYGRVSIVESMGDAVRATRKRVDRHHAPALSLLLVPLIYGARKLFESGTQEGPDPARDALENALLSGAYDRRLPVLGICRGAQLLNVWLGGTLHQDIHAFYAETPRLRSVLPKKRVQLTAGSRLARAMGAQECAINALHDQAIDTLGRGLCVVAREANGIVQAIELPSHPFMVGVQWHPEYIPQHRKQRALFAAFVRAARAAPDA